MTLLSIFAKGGKALVCYIVIFVQVKVKITTVKTIRVDHFIIKTNSESKNTASWFSTC